MSGKKIGYLRVSTPLKNEERRLSGIELDKKFIEKASARDTNRPLLKTMLDFVREGDEVYIHDTSRLARNISDLQSPVETITGKGAVLKFVKENLTFTSDRNDPMSELLLNLLGSVYAFERQILLERQREVVQIAKQAGKYTVREIYRYGRDLKDSGVWFIHAKDCGETWNFPEFRPTSKASSIKGGRK